MDLLGNDPVLKLNDEEWRIYARHEPHAPQYVGENAVVDNSSITEGCEIYGTVRNSVLGSNVKVMKGAVVSESVILEDVVIGENAQVHYSIIDHGSTIGARAKIGSDKKKSKGITVIGAGIPVADDTVIGDNKMISDVSDIEKEAE